ncbi:MAG: hypothetical protein ABIG60_05225 [Patescibacteria group bacterium]
MERSSCVEKNGSMEGGENTKIQLVKVGGLGQAFFRQISVWQPNQNCRHCGRKTEHEVITKRRFKDGAGIAIPCCKNEECYKGVIKQISSMINHR